MAGTVTIYHATNKSKILNVTLQILHSAREKTLKTFKISINILIIRSKGKGHPATVRGGPRGSG